MAIIENVAPNSGSSKVANLTVFSKFVLEARLTLVAMITKIWDSTSNNEILYGLWQKDWTDTVFDRT